MSFYTTTFLLLANCSSVFLMEILMVKNCSCANLFTFLIFFFTSIFCFVFSMKLGREKPKIPIGDCVKLIISYFISFTGSNYVYTLHVSTTLHMIIGTAFPAAAALMCYFVNNELPKTRHIVGSLLISVGVAIAIYGGTPASDKIFTEWCLGVTLLLITLITSAFSMYQEQLLFHDYGVHLDELLVYTHGVPLPLFFGIYSELIDTSFGLSWDEWLLIFIIIIFQLRYLYSIKKLAVKEATITLTFIITLRKFISLFISAVVYKSNMTVYHVIGRAFAAVGTYVYYSFFSRSKDWPFSTKVKSEVD